MKGLAKAYFETAWQILEFSHDRLNLRKPSTKVIVEIAYCFKKKTLTSCNIHKSIYY